MDNFNKKPFPTIKVIFAILGLILLGEVIYAVIVLKSPVAAPPPAPTTVSQPTVGRISLDAPKTKYQLAEIIPVSVMIDTGSNTIDGVDFIVKFPKILEATQGGLIKGTILDEYPLMSVDASKGLISISGVNSTGGFKGIGQFAVINFKAKKTGQSSLIVDFQKDSTIDSNLVETDTSKDILEQVDNLEIEVQ
ncbi:hypothetical protein HYU94_01190 [Candidatus Daviesbacteria bacterium]|nr:hypothetical protein [Candidatus Daviesbacteria bacterium]